MVDLSTLKANIIGLEKEIEILSLSSKAGVPILLEGDVGTGKTELAKQLAAFLDRPFYRIDGNDSLNAIKITGWFDPALVLEKGFSMDTFVPGPLAGAMLNGGVFFFNEANRAPSESINAVLSALDEGVIYVPRLGPIKAIEGFLPIFTINPREHIGTNPLPRAFYDRCAWINLDHQPIDDMIEIVKLRVPDVTDEIALFSCQLVKMTWDHPSIETGSSVRGAIQLAYLLTLRGMDNPEIIYQVAEAVITKKIVSSPSTEKEEKTLVKEVVKMVLNKS
jgi:MoxR-like ATPase